MDEEDIPANFLEEEEWEAFTDNYEVANEPTPKHHLLFYTLEQKEKNVHEA
jgi:hypothetical protein